MNIRNVSVSIDKLNSRISALEEQVQELREIILMLVDKSELLQADKDTQTATLERKGMKILEVRPVKAPHQKSVEDLLAESQGTGDKTPR